MSIANVTALVAQCWSGAEENLREQLRTNHPDCDEEFITKFFHGEFRGTLVAATRKGKVKQAFLRDLKSHLPDMRSSLHLDRLASGISASVTLHPRETEKETGGDLGLVLIRPNINCHNSTPTMDENYRRGLLCQAKIKRRPSCSRGSYWGGFKENQRKRLIDRMGYLALLLYEYQDAQRTNLLPFRWQVCRGKSMDDVEGWLRGDSFPDLSTSEKIIQLLGDDKIGTGDKGIIDKLIAPLGVRDTLIVRIGWPSDQGPTRYALLQQMFQERNQTHIKHAEH